MQIGIYREKEENSELLAEFSAISSNAPQKEQEKITKQPLISKEKEEPISNQEENKGQSLEGHVLKEQIGEGAFGTVHKAISKMGRTVAIKIPKKEQFYGLLEEEAKVNAQLDHASIIKIFDVVYENGKPHLIMEYHEGTQKLDVEKPQTLEQKVNIILDVGVALRHAQRKGIIHPDINPSNILVDEEGAYIIDFGKGKESEFAESENTLVTEMHEPHVLGTLMYLAPEIISGEQKPDEKTTVYSLGVLLYQLLVEKREHIDSDIREVFKERNVNEKYAHIAINATRTNRAKRCTLQEFIDSLEEIENSSSFCETKKANKTNQKSIEVSTGKANIFKKKFLGFSGGFKEFFGYTVERDYRNVIDALLDAKIAETHEEAAECVEYLLEKKVRYTQKYIQPSSYDHGTLRTESFRLVERESKERNHERKKYALLFSKRTEEVSSRRKASKEAEQFKKLCENNQFDKNEITRMLVESGLAGSQEDAYFVFEELEDKGAIYESCNECRDDNTQDVKILKLRHVGLRFFERQYKIVIEEIKSQYSQAA